MVPRLAPVVAVLAVLAGACREGGIGESGGERAPAGVDLDAVPALDTSEAAVPLEDIVFDTFDGGVIPLSEASQDQIRALRDAIRPVYDPGYAGADGLPWLEDSDLVLGYVSEGGAAYAYPLKVLNFRELVNDEIDGVPVLVSYCPLCASGVVYDRRLGGQTLLFGNTSSLFQSDLVMYDHQTGSYWFQVAGEAIVGELTGARLEPLPSTVAPWGEWKALHPGTRLLVSDGGEAFGLEVARDPFAGLPEALDEGRFPFPVSDERLDPRLPASELVVTVEIGGAAKAYPVRLLGDAAVNDELGGEAVVLFSRGAGLAAVFRSEAGGQDLTFRLEADGFRDEETGSTWDAAGRAIAGPLAGSELEPLPSRRSFWFSIAGARPGLNLYLPG